MRDIQRSSPSPTNGRSFCLRAAGLWLPRAIPPTLCIQPTIEALGYGRRPGDFRCRDLCRLKTIAIRESDRQSSQILRRMFIGKLPIEIDDLTPALFDAIAHFLNTLAVALKIAVF